ncbi:6-phosphogluconolactonase [Novosphingobium sp. FSY-8]|uniref:6-phosphogluconolactonase n=1 Tax=Novosphingobium ovatum TaxID=1908523 RepID=A0ABW9XH01_9SPHN|nr:6-phosphogluconolactonase [Novosphingobium ovatum]NBC37766.1 6-phosphogluconolactonase [Novosphingobium ovatum]
MTQTADIQIIPGASDADIAAAIAQRLRAALAAGEGPIAITIPGGSTPFPILALLAQMDLPWGRIAVWPGDDRIVAEDHPASNVGRIRAALEPLGAQVIALSEDAVPPHFALAWLGMGNDGHIASLFPNTDPTANAPARIIRLTPDPLPPEAPFDRLSMTIPLLIASDGLMFVIRGDDKRALFEAAARAEHDLPVARLLAVASGTVQCFC